MSRNRIMYNSEGYRDPTAGAALSHIIHEERVKRKRQQTHTCEHSDRYTYPKQNTDSNKQRR